MTLPTPLARIRDELEAARARAHAVSRSVGEKFKVRPAPDRWSVGECLAHLNESTRLYLPPIDEAIAPQFLPSAPDKWRPRRDFVGWFLCVSMEPPVRIKIKTTQPFEPSDIGTHDQVMTMFDQMQDALLERLEGAAGLDISRVRMTSPFDSRFKYSVYSAFRITSAHQRRHLWQAERVLRDLAVV